MIHNRTVVALLPIKDHSERVSGKNFRDFCGKPLYHHMLSALDRTFAVDSVIINTDSHRVMNEAPGCSSKVDVVKRPDEICGDFVSMNRIIEHDLTHSDGDIYLQVHATSPLIKPETIANALRKFIEVEGDYDSLFSVNAFHSRFYTKDGAPVNHDPENLLRTQDLPPLYEENSCIYVFTKASFEKKGRRIGEKPFMFPTPTTESIDIDDGFSFKLAELLGMYAKD